MYAIIEDSGKQFKVSTGDVIRVDHLFAEGELPETLKFDRVLLVGGEGATKIGQPTLAGASVTAKVVRAVKGKKIESVKYKRRKGFHKTVGHRQKYTEVKITAITA
jgi:large subunit ribosomal protein L21